MKKIKELQKRSELDEGRDFGLGFTILNKIGSKFETYLPFTACRDYLNDFIFVEKFKTEIGYIYGYNHRLLNCFDNKKFFYIGIKSLDYNNGKKWMLTEQLQIKLINNYKNLELFLNNIENNLKFKSRTKIIIDENTLIIKVPIYWSKSTPLISIYTLLIRCYFNVNNDFIISTENLKAHCPFIQNDTYFIKSCVKFFDNLQKVKFENVDYSNYDVFSNNVSSVHNFGIQKFLGKI